MFSVMSIFMEVVLTIFLFCALGILLGLFYVLFIKLDVDRICKSVEPVESAESIKSDVVKLTESGWNELLELLYEYNEDDVRYLIVDELPAIEDVVDRRALYVTVDFMDDILVFYNVYTCVAGTWYTVDTLGDISDYLGKVD